MRYATMRLHGIATIAKRRGAAARAPAAADADAHDVARAVHEPAPKVAPPQPRERRVQRQRGEQLPVP
jgi:hypothetical protein